MQATIQKCTEIDRYFNINFEIITFNIIFFFNSLIRNFWVKEGLLSCRDSYLTIQGVTDDYIKDKKTNKVYRAIVINTPKFLFSQYW